MIFLSKSARPYLQEVVALITTRVKVPGTDGYKKLGGVIKYLMVEP